MARTQGFRHTVYGQPNIGGRYSALSNFGMAPSALMGVDVDAFLASAQEMVQACRQRIPAAENPGVVLGTALGSFVQHGRDKVTLVMLHAIRDHYLSTGEMIAMKPAGGIRTSKQALHYLMMVKEELGPEWLHPHWFRFGASSLANDILMQLQKEADGHYQSADYFSID